ncbi:hypothetical protein AGMMS49579_07350 [Spirochaetia bacterium]|nr:hypothetical protein AGMMS49579_07350 [Spirochaetia bacterium]
MKLEIICEGRTLDDCKANAESILGVSLRLFREELSVFEQYLVRPAERKHIPEIWKYRIIAKNGSFYLGKI